MSANRVIRERESRRAKARYRLPGGAFTDRGAAMDLGGFNFMGSVMRGLSRFGFRVPVPVRLPALTVQAPMVDLMARPAAGSVTHRPRGRG